MIYVIFNVYTFQIAEFCFSEDEVLDLFKTHYFGFQYDGFPVFNWKAINLVSFLKSSEDL